MYLAQKEFMDPNFLIHKLDTKYFPWEFISSLNCVVGKEFSSFDIDVSNGYIWIINVNLYC